MNPEISIIVPIYNGEKYMRKCIDSILNQTFANIEVILVDDGSSDKSRYIISEYVKQDKRVVAIYQKNSGPSIARNNGIKIARGKYLGFVDSDDYINELMYEKLYRLVNEYRVQMGMCAYKETYLYDNTEKIVNTNLKETKIYNKEEIRKYIISTFANNENFGFYCLWNKIYLREFIIENKILMDEAREHGEDWWFNISLFNLLESYIYTDEALYNYIHVNENSLMSKYRENQFDLFLDGRKKIKLVVPAEFINFKEFNNRFIYEFSAYIIRTFKEINDKNKSNRLIDNVLNNEDVIDACNNHDRLPLHFKVVTFFIKIRAKKLSKLVYRCLSLILLK